MQHYKMLVIAKHNNTIRGYIGNLLARCDDIAASMTFNYWMENLVELDAEFIRVVTSCDGKPVMVIDNGQVDINPMGWTTEDFEDVYSVIY